jgi:activator of HSP90 ATPase
MVCLTMLWVLSPYKLVCILNDVLQFDFSLTSAENSASSQLLSFLRRSFPPILKEKFNSLRPALIAVHGQPSESTPIASGTSTPNPTTSSSSYAPAPPAQAPVAEKKKDEGKKLSGTATVEVKAQLHASAQDIWGLLTEEGKIPMWSRAPAKVCRSCWKSIHNANPDSD